MEDQSNLNIIRKIKCEDYDSNYFSLLRQLTSCNKERISREVFNDFVNSLNDKHQIWLIVDRSNNRIIATGTILIEDKIIHDMGKVAHIEDIIVDSESRGGGYGRVILDFLKNIAIKKECYKIILDCNESNEGFYKRCGYERKGIQTAKYFPY